MPCYQVQTLSVELNNADHDLLEKALAKLGYTVRRTEKTLSFSKGSVTGRYVNDKLVISNSDKKTPVDTDAIKKGYSKEVVTKMAKKAAAQGWTVKRTSEDEMIFEAPPGGNELQA